MILMWKYYSYILCRPKDEVEQMRAQVAEGYCILGRQKRSLAQAVVERFVDQAAAEDASAEFTRFLLKSITG